MGLVFVALAVARAGEAKNPGPRKSGDQLYADPYKPTFQGARIAGGDERASGCAADEPPAEQLWALEVVTANTTRWGPLKRFLMATKADAVLAQEHRLHGEEVAEASDWALRRGWKSVWAQAKCTEAGGRSGGVVILARSHLGLSPPPWEDPVIVEGQAVAATLEAPTCRPKVLTSVYLLDGVGLAAANRSILAAIGSKLQTLGHGAEGDSSKHCGPMPYIVGGGCSLTPQDIAETDFAANIGATVVAPRNARGTCRTATSCRTLDFFLVSRGLDQGISSVAVDDKAVIKTHVPVALRFRPRLTSLRALALRAPPHDAHRSHLRPTSAAA